MRPCLSPGLRNKWNLRGARALRLQGWLSYGLLRREKRPIRMRADLRSRMWQRYVHSAESLCVFRRLSKCGKRRMRTCLLDLQQRHVRRARGLRMR